MRRGLRCDARGLHGPRAGVLLMLAVPVALMRPLPAAAAPASEQQCLDRFRAETTRIEREFAARRKAGAASAAGGDQAWSRELHAALAKAADAAEACSRDARKARQAAPGRP